MWIFFLMLTCSINQPIIRTNSPNCQNCLHFVPTEFNKPSLCSRFISVGESGTVQFQTIAECRLDRRKCGMFGKYFFPNGTLL